MNSYEWIIDNEEQELTTLFFNYVALGQFELARATILQLHAKEPVKVLTLLKTIVHTGAPKEWYDDISHGVKRERSLLYAPKPNCSILEPNYF